MKIELKKPVYKNMYVIEIVANNFERIFNINEEGLIELGPVLRKMQQIQGKIGNWCHKEKYFSEEELDIIDEIDMMCWGDNSEEAYTIEQVNIYFESARDSVLYEVTLG